MKAEVGRRWGDIFLLDMLKEADIRIGFTRLFKSPTPHEILPREILQIRLLLCLYALGTNAGVKRVASGTQTESFRDLFYVLKRRGTADAEAILSRFTRSRLMHPVFQALLELGKVRKTIFLCEYLHSEALRQEIQEGLNVVEKGCVRNTCKKVSLRQNSQ